MTEAELAIEEKLRKKREEQEQIWQEYLEQREEQRQKEEDDLRKLKERQVSDARQSIDTNWIFLAHLASAAQSWLRCLLVAPNKIDFLTNYFSFLLLTHWWKKNMADRSKGAKLSELSKSVSCKRCAGNKRKLDKEN